MPSFTWKIVRNVRAREGCRNYLELTESVFYYCKTAAGKLATMISPWSFPWRRLIKRSNTATFKLTKNLRGDPPYFTNTYRVSTGEREFSAVERKAILLRKKRYQSIQWIDADGSNFLPTGNLFFYIERTREVGKFAHGTIGYVVRWSCFFATTHYYRRFDICRRTRDEKYRHGIIVLRATSCGRHSRTPKNFMGATRGLCRKEKWPRRHTWAEALRAILKWDSLTTVGNC